MKNKLIKSILLTSCLMLFTITVWAEQTNYSSSSGGMVLATSPGTRGLAMGKSNVATANVFEALIWNPASLSHASEIELGFTHGFWIVDASYEDIRLAFPGLDGGFAFGLEYVQYGVFDMYEYKDNGELIDKGSVVPVSWYGQAGYGQYILKDLSLGAVFHFLYTSAVDDSDLTISGSLGATYLLQPINCTVGAVFKNVNYSDGEGMGNGDIQLGIAYQPEWDILDENQFILELDSILYADTYHFDSINFGLEFQYKKVLCFRMGLIYLDPGLSIQELTYTAGFGVKYKNWNIEYAYQPHSVLGDTHLIALKFRL